VKFRTDPDALADAVAWTARTLPVRPLAPVLAGILIEVDEQQLKLSSFDYEVSARVVADVEVEEPGTALVSGRLFAEIVRSLPAHPVQISMDASKVTLRCGSAKFTLLSLPVEDYPSLPAMPPAIGSVGSDAFAAAVNQVAIAASRDDSIPMLTGVRVEIAGEAVTLAATNRYRLAVRELRWNPHQRDFPVGALVPAKALADTAKTLTAGAEVTIYADDTTFGVAGGGRQMTSRLLDGEFVNYRSLLPKQATSIAQIETGPFIEAVKRVALVAERNTPVQLAFSGGELVLQAGTGDEAQAVEILPAGLDGEEISIAFNPAFLLDGLGAIGSDLAHLAMTTPTKPAVLTGKPDGWDGENPDYRYLIMPIRLTS
jgi:DNA polymerase-3 subunit beta